MSEPTAEQNQSPKRQAIAADVTQLTARLLDVLTALQARAREAAQSGNYTQEDFDRPDLAHLTPFLLQNWLAQGVARLTETLAAEAYPQGPTVEDLALQVRS